MGGDFDVVVLGVIEGIGSTDSNGYRRVVIDVRAVLRGSAPRAYEFSYPAAADEPEPMFVRGASYLVAIESEGITGGPTASECSATKQIANPEEINRYIGLSASPTIYGEVPAARSALRSHRIGSLEGPWQAFSRSALRIGLVHCRTHRNSAPAGAFDENKEVVDLMVSSMVFGTAN